MIQTNLFMRFLYQNITRAIFLLMDKVSSKLLEPDIVLQTAKEEVSFLRMANIGYLANRVTFPAELNAQIISTDG